MPLCGFNEKMLKGETLVYVGLVEGLLKKNQGERNGTVRI